MLDRESIAKMLGIKRDLFRKRVEARPDFPPPALRLSRKTVLWDEAPVREWIQQQRQRA